MACSQGNSPVVRRRQVRFVTCEALSLFSEAAVSEHFGGAAFEHQAKFSLNSTRKQSHLFASASCAAASQPTLGFLLRGSELRGGGSTVMLDVPRSDDTGLNGLWEAVNYSKYLVSGAMSAVVARSVVAPFERVKIDILLRKASGTAVETAIRIFQAEGVAGFWKGNGLNLLRTAPHKAVNFTSYDVYSNSLRGLVEAYAPEHGDADGMRNAARFLAGALAGVTATLLCFPLDVLRVRMLAPGGSPYGGIAATVKGVLKHEGPGRFYTGVLPAIISMAPAGAVFYGVYDLLKDWALRADAASGGAVDEQGLGPARTLLFGGLAGAAAEGFVYPLEVVRRQMQVYSIGAACRPGHGAAGRGSPVALMLDAARAVVQSKGLRGFYSGVIPSIVQVLPNAALSYFTYEVCKNALGAQPLHGDHCSPHLKDKKGQGSGTSSIVAQNDLETEEKGSE